MRAETPPFVHEPGLLDLARVLLPRWRSLVAIPLLVGLVALAASFLVPPVFVATARVLPPQQQGSAAAMLAQQLGALSLLAGAAGFKNPADQFVALLKSRSIADRLIERHALRNVYGVELQEDARRVLSDNTSIVVGKEGLIVVEVYDVEPRRAADLANGYVEELRRMTRQMAVGEASQRREFFETQLAAARDRLAAAEIALKRSAVPESTLKAEPRAAVETIARIRAAVTGAEIRLGAMRGYLSDSSPDVRQAQQELAALRAQLAKAQRADSPAEEALTSDYIALYREFKYQEVLFELIAKQYEIARLDEARDGTTVQVVDSAVPAERKARPKRALIAILATLATGLTLVFFHLLRYRISLDALRPVVGAGALRP